jgi:hypothetical protein
MDDSNFQPADFRGNGYYLEPTLKSDSRSETEPLKLHLRNDDRILLEHVKPACQQTSPRLISEHNEEIRFQHEPLHSRRREIRLLSVLPGEDCDVITCEIRTVDFVENPVYTALSYTWNNSNDDFAFIMCTGKPMQIGKNLWLFLHEFRRRMCASGACLWVDAICIDQLNIQERNHQVAQMRDIYSKAASVIVWLGESSNDDALAFGMVGGERRLVFTKGQDLRLHRSKRQWNALAVVLNKPYWTRVWITQEFLLACTLEVWCGSYGAPWKSFEHICQSLEGLVRKRTLHHSSKVVLQTRGCILGKQRLEWRHKQAKQHEFSGLSLRQLIKVHATSESSDTRDKVYSLLGLAYDAAISNFPVIADYSKSNVEVLINVIRNQCQGSSSAQKKASQAFVNLMKGILNVSHAELAVHVLHHARDIQPIMRVPVVEGRAHTTLRIIGTIIALDFHIEPEGLSSKQTFAESRCRIQPYIDSEWLSSNAASTLSRLASSAEAQDVLRVKSSDSEENEILLSSLYESCEGNLYPAEKVLESEIRCQVRQRQRDLGRPWRSHADRINPTNTTSRRAFIGTDGFVGWTVSSLAQCGDVVGVFSDAYCDKIAVILHPYLTTGLFIVVDVALYSVKTVCSQDYFCSNRAVLEGIANLQEPGYMFFERGPDMDESIYDYKRPRDDFVRSEDPFVDESPGNLMNIQIFPIATDYMVGTELQLHAEVPVDLDGVQHRIWGKAHASN